MKTWQKSIIEFFVIVFSILAAFWLDEYRDDREKEERVKNAMMSIRSEVTNNLKSLKYNYETILNFNEYYRFIISKSSDPSDDFSAISLRKDELDSLIKLNNRFERDLKLIRSINSEKGVYSVNFSIDFFLEETSTSSWEATKTSGVLNEFKHWQIEPIVKVYNWFERDFGVTESDFYKTILINPDEFLDLTAMYNSSYKIESVLNMKLSVFEDKLPEFLEFLDEQIEK